MGELQKWASTAGPRQLKGVQRALSGILGAGRSRVELTGVHGKPETEHRGTYMQPFSTPSAESLAAWDELGKRYGWTITRDNHKGIVHDACKARADLLASLPVDDKRRTQEQEAESDERNAADTERWAREAAERNANQAAIMAKAPSWARALIVAEDRENDSDSMTDYFASHSTREVAIGWRRSSREDFRALRAAAGGFEPTAHLGPGCDFVRVCWLDPGEEYRGELWRDDDARPRIFTTEEAATEAAEAEKADTGREYRLDVEKVEHRDNYSMGAGNYLQVSGSHASGWRVRSVSLPLGSHDGPFEDALPAMLPAAGPEGQDPKQHFAGAGMYSIEEHTHTKRGVQMFLVILADRVDRADYLALVASCRAAGGWYSRKWGKTPGGFAFEDQQAAEAWAAEALTPAAV